MIFYMKLLLIFLWLILVPFFVGNNLFKYSKTNYSVSLQYIQGWVIMMAIFQILAIPMIFLKVKFLILVITWSLIILFLGIRSIIIKRKIYAYTIKEFGINLKRIPFQMILAIFLIIIQTVIVVFFQHVDDDDAFFVGTAVTTYQSNSMFEVNPYTGDLYTVFPDRYVLSPFPVFIALIGKLTMIHPTIIAHTVLPAFLIPLAYMVYYLIGKKLFSNDKIKIGIFLILVSVLNLWGNFSVYTTSSFLLFRIWQGKAILANILLPLVLYYILRIVHDKGKWTSWMVMLFLVLAGAMVSSMGIFLMPILLGIYAITYLLVKRDILIFMKILLCCIPSIVYGLIYICVRYKGVFI